MTAVALGLSDWKRDAAQAPRGYVVNRFFEQTPDPEHGPVSLLARPGLKYAVAIGDGPIRGTYSQPGTFSDNLFAVSGDDLFRVDAAGTNLGTISTGGTSAVSFTATPDLGAVPSYLFLADGGILWLYMENGQASGQLQASSTIANLDVVRIDSVYYQFTTGSVDAGTPAGTVGNPWLVFRTGVNSADLGRLFAAINDSGVEGTDYSTALTAHPTVVATQVTTNDLYVSAKTPGTGGNAIVTTETGANLAWGGGTLSGGGSDALRQIPTPDSVGIVSVDYIAGYVICVCAQDEGVNGRFYWLEPGETEIDALNFATAERAPDPVYSVRVVGDQPWFLGSSSVEPWYLTGADAAPFARQQSRLFDWGVWEGTDVDLKGTIVVVDREDGTVYAIGGGGPQRISTNAVEDRIRQAQAIQKRLGF